MFPGPRFLAGMAAGLSLVAAAAGHPGEVFDKRAHMDELANGHAVAEVNARALEACQDRPEVIARKQRAIARRAATFERLRRERGLSHESRLVHRRDAASFAKWAGTRHDFTGELAFDRDTPAELVFGANTSCTLAPDNANGPYFVHQALLRQDLAETLAGVPLHLELQVVDVTTCAPAAGVLVDVWACNATGAYSGVSAPGQAGLDTTFLRGVQPTDPDGVVRFDTLFPGHYEGRATHEHVIAHVGSRVLANGTYTGGVVAHLSQLFFDQALVDAVEATAPYAGNGIAPTRNLDDLFTGYAASPRYDPFVNYVLLSGGGGDGRLGLDAGLFAWAELGIDTRNNWDYYAPYAATWKEGGGYDNPDFNRMIVGTPPPSHG